MRKAELAIAFHEIREEVIDRQRRVWLHVLALVLNAQNSPDTTPVESAESQMGAFIQGMGGAVPSDKPKG